MIAKIKNQLIENLKKTGKKENQIGESVESSHDEDGISHSKRYDKGGEMNA